MASIIQCVFIKLGTYELRGRHAALFAANLRAIDNLSPRTASRLVHRLGESSTPQAWEQQHREFLANGGLAPGLEGDLTSFLRNSLPISFTLAHLLSIAKSSYQKFGKNEALRSSTSSTMNTWKIRMALTAWPWTAGRRPTGELALHLPELGGISVRR